MLLYEASTVHARRPKCQWPTWFIRFFFCLALAAWMLWFLWESTPYFESGQVVGFDQRGTITAMFNADINVRPGQKAYVYQTRLSETAFIYAIPAMVRRVEVTAIEGNLLAEVEVRTDLWFVLGEIKERDAILAVEVATEQISPAQLVLRSSLRDIQPLWMQMSQ